MISFLAGKKALAKIRDSGFGPDDVEVVPGAAGGPKWLIMRHLDSFLFSSWFAGRGSPLFLVGSSIGAWRFAAASRHDPEDALERFRQAYLDQHYEKDPPPQAVNKELERILNTLLGEDGASEILSHPFYRLNVLAVRCRGWTGSEKRAELLPALAAAAACNAMFRRALGLFFERTLFYDPRTVPPFIGMNDFPVQKVPLDRGNLAPALMASGSIPLLMHGIKDIPGARPGVYRDGGIIDYHLNIPYGNSDHKIVLFPHYAEKIVPGWLDKHVFWRRPASAYLDNVLLAAPSENLLKRLPMAKVPDRHDFYLFAGKDAERMQYWQKAVDLGRKAAEEFAESVESGRIRDRVRPIEEIA